MPLTIAHWHQSVHLAGPHRAPQAVCEQLNTLVQGSRAAIGQALGAYLAARPGEVIRVRRLEVDLVFDCAAEPGFAARSLAQRFARRLVDEIESGSAQVVRFASQIDYLAGFAVALAQGNAHQRWYFADFAGLAMLPPSAALRTLIESRPEIAWPLLARVLSIEAPQVALDEADAWRVLQVLEDQALDDDELEALANACLLRVSAARPTPFTPATPQALLALLAQAHHAGASPSRGLLAGALTALLVSMALAVGDSALLQHLLEPDGPVPRQPSPTARRMLLRLAEHKPGVALQELVRQLVARIDSAAQAATAQTEWHCPHAGLILLLGEIDDLLDATFSAALPASQHGRSEPFGVALPALQPARSEHFGAAQQAPQHGRGAFALALLATAAGPQQAAQVWLDAAWRALLGVDAELSWDEFARSLHEHGDVIAARHAWSALARRQRRAWRAARADGRSLDHAALHEVCSDHWRGLLICGAQFVWRRVALRVPGMWGSSLPYLRDKLLGGPGSVTLRSTGCDDEVWHWRSARAPLHVLVAMTALSHRDQVWRGAPLRRIRLEFA